MVVYIDAEQHRQPRQQRSQHGDQATIRTTVNEAGQYSFTGLAPGTYVVRELPPSGTVETAPSSAAVTTTIDFDGTGGESGITGAGVTSFTYHGASFSGGTIFAPPCHSALLASGTLAYNASSGTPEVNFSQPISSATFFYVHGFGFGRRHRHGLRRRRERRRHREQQGRDHERRPGQLRDARRFAKPIAQITFVGGVIDNFTFTTAANNQAEFVACPRASQTVSGMSFGDQCTVASTDLEATA